MGWFSNLPWDSIAKAVGIGGQAYDAYTASQAALSKDDIIDIWRQQQGDYVTPTRTGTVEFGPDGRPTYTTAYTPQIQGLFDSLVADAGRPADRYVIGGDLQRMDRAGQDYQLNRYNMAPSYMPPSGVWPGGSPGGGSPGMGDEDQPDYGPGGDPGTPGGGTYPPVGNVGEVGNGGAGGGGGGPYGGSPTGGAGAGAGAGVGIGAGGGGTWSDFGDMWSNQPDGMQALINNELFQRAMGASTGIPGIGQLVDFLNNRYPSGVMDPDSPNFIEPGGQPGEGEPIDTTWGTGWMDQDQPPTNAVGSGRDIYGTRGQNIGQGLVGSLGRGGNRFNPYNRVIYQRDPNQRGPVFEGPDSTTPGDRYAYGPKPPWEQQR